jgi:hypothetical protein
MIASKVTSGLFCNAGITQKILKFPKMSSSPRMGRFSAGELNVI